MSPTNRIMFQAAQNRYILYPGSGTDLSPLLAENRLQEKYPRAMQELRRHWSLSTLLLCDNSPLVHRFFDNLTAGDVLFDREKGLLRCEEEYRAIWMDSPLERLIVAQSATQEIPSFFGDGTPLSARQLTLEATAAGQALYARVDFYPCGFSDITEYGRRKPGAFEFTGMFLLGMSSGKAFTRDPAVAGMRFIVSDLPPMALPDGFLPIPIRLPGYGSGKRLFSSTSGAAIYLNRSEFAAFERPPGTFWVVPGLLLAGMPDASDEELAAGAGIRETVQPEPETVNRFVMDQDDILPGETIHSTPNPGIASSLDRIDQSIGEGKTTLIKADPGSGELGTVLGCWLVRHGLAGGEQVRKHLETLSDIAGNAPSLWPQDTRSQGIIRSWQRGR